MKQLVNNVRLLLSEKRGETLIEGLASILVFVVLVATVTMMLMVSLRITNNTTIAAELRQDEAAALLAVVKPPEVVENDGEFRFIIDPARPIIIDATIFSTVGGLEAFETP